ncbi:MAG: hypothetical protein IPG68_04760 [Micrococcales bacterium]|nr:hypothetical protein [Micrococcales bacterium]
MVAGGWWVAVVELVPASIRPYIGGSQTDSALELILGYNGLGRRTGDETGSVGGGAGRAAVAGDAELAPDVRRRLGRQIAACGARGDRLRLGAGRRPDAAGVHDPVGRLAGRDVCRLRFSQGIIHQYYAVALAPAIAVLAGHGGHPAVAARGLCGLAVFLACSALYGGTLLVRATTTCSAGWSSRWPWWPESPSDSATSAGRGCAPRWRAP